MPSTRRLVPAFPLPPLSPTLAPTGTALGAPPPPSALKYQGVVTVSCQPLFPLPYALLLIMPSSRTKPGVFILACGAQQSVLWGRGRGACNLPVTQPRTPGPDQLWLYPSPCPAVRPRGGQGIGAHLRPQGSEGGRPQTVARGGRARPRPGCWRVGHLREASSADGAGDWSKGGWVRGGCPRTVASWSWPATDLGPPLRPTEETRSRLA